MNKQETFKETTSLYLQNSFGIIREENDVEVEVTVGIKDDNYGYFELYDTKTGGEKWYCEGGLWFQDKTLVDYDGVFNLPPMVKDKLTEWGYLVEGD